MSKYLNSCISSLNSACGVKATERHSGTNANNLNETYEDSVFI